MAAHSNNIRLRLYFDYPPPAVIGCRMCWLLIDLNACRVVADLESVIREKFEFSGGSILSLFIEDCYLPHTESIYVVRDNDSVRVKVGYLNELSGYSSHPDAASESSRKRRRAGEDTVPEENGVSVEWKKKKSKKKNEDRMTDGANLVASDDQNENIQGKPREKKKKKKRKEKDAAVTPKPADFQKKIQAAVRQPSESTKELQASKPKTQKASSSDSSSSSSDEDVVPKKTTKTPTSTPAPSKVPSNRKPAPTKSHPPLSSSSETDSSSDEAASVKIQPRNKPLTTTTASSQSSRAPSDPEPTNDNPEQTASMAEPPHTAAKVANPDSEEEIQLVIRRPLQQPKGGIGIQSHWRGRGRGKARCGGGQGASGTGGGRGATSENSSSFGSSYNGATELSYQNDSLTNTSMILQNGAVSVPKQDYNSMPLLAAPPQVGQRIAFKLLELTENYTPEVSEYKEGKMVSFDPITRQTELELINVPQASVEPGKFDLVYQNPDGSERVEYAVSRGSWVTERWESLLEPRLII